MMQYETIPESIYYFIGNRNQIPIGNLGQLIRGLQEYGPYEKVHLRYQRIGILYLNNSMWNGKIAEVKKEIISKFQKFWHLSGLNIDDFVYNSADLSTLQEKVDEAIGQGLDGIVVTLPGDIASVYYRLKAYLINSNIPSQFIRYDKLSQRDIRFYTDNLVVQLFSKLGGRPWILSMDPEKGSDIIIGTGATRIGRENLFCFAMIFRKDGTMMWNEISPIVRKEEYLRHLKEIIIKAVKGFKQENPNWQVVKLTLHVSSKRPKISGGETEILESTIEELKCQNLISENVKFSILHINETHPYWLMGDPNNRYHPYEGIKVKLSSKRYLITISQPQQGRYEPTIPIPIKPLSVEIVKHNWTEEDFYQCSKEVIDEVYFLSKMNWRGFRGRNLPVTVNYPKLVARIIANINFYNGPQINTEGNRQLQIFPWFL